MTAPKPSAADEAREWVKRLRDWASGWEDFESNESTRIPKPLMSTTEARSFANLLETLLADNECKTKALEGQVRECVTCAGTGCVTEYVEGQPVGVGGCPFCEEVRAALRPKEDR